MTARQPAHGLLCVVLLMWVTTTPAWAAITCEQLAEIAAATQKLRDQGHSLTMVQSEVDRLQIGEKLTAADIRGIKAVVEQAFYNGSSFPLEVLKRCRADGRK